MFFIKAGRTTRITYRKI